MEKSTFFQAQAIRKDIELLEQMGKGDIIWSVKVNNESYQYFPIDKPIKEAYEKARKEMIKELEEQFKAL